jgi:hypothetical protein
MARCGCGKHRHSAYSPHSVCGVEVRRLAEVQEVVQEQKDEAHQALQAQQQQQQQ